MLLYLIKGEVREESTRLLVESAEQELLRVSEVVRHSLKFHRQATKPERERIADLLESTLTVYEARYENNVRLTFIGSTSIRLLFSALAANSARCSGIC